jgi:hypothetical protein
MRAPRLLLPPGLWLGLGVALLFAGCNCGGTKLSDVGHDGGAADAGPAVDAGSQVDAGPQLNPDAGPKADAGAPDGGTGLVLDATVGASFGPEVAAAVKARVLDHLRAVWPTLVEVPDAPEPALANGALHLAFGHSATADRLGAAAEALGQAPEGFVVQVEASDGGKRAVAVGNPTEPRSNDYAAYALLEELGFAFLHPLAPARPLALADPPATLHLVVEKPRWKTRTIHVHTQHPLELTEMLQGWGAAGPDDAQGFTDRLPEWDTYLEWLLANRQNGVEWFLLWADSWKDFADGPVRQARLKTLVDRAHDFGLRAGLDVPIVFGQQHAFRLLRNQQQSNEPAELAEIDARLDYVLAAGFDFLGTESGTSEFTAPAPQRMLDWMNEVTRHADTRHVPVFIKAHASAGQKAAGFPDPVTGQDINFNFLPHFADPKLGVLPHTVEIYGLHDPAPTYGNTDFRYLEDFLRQETGLRPVLWYPESAYWVSVDIDVPLFLPIYARRRLDDLRLLAADEDQGRMGAPGAHMDGQLLFSSGWEWGYWLNDVVAARAAWSPSPRLTDTAALAAALQPVVRHMGAKQAQIAQWLADFAEAERAMLIYGEVNGVGPADIRQRNGMGYLEGWDTWDDVAKLTGVLPATQPDKLGLVDMRNPAHGGPGYTAEVDPLLAEMEREFAALSAQAEALRPSVPAPMRDLFDDLADAAKMTALRAKQVHGLYLYVDGYFDQNQNTRLQELGIARQALDDAAAVVAAREARYRVPVARIGAWRDNPTAYPFTYLWMTHSLYAWWRDEGKAVDAPLLPCYLNVINPVDVAFGEGFGNDAAQFIGSALSTDDQRGCLAEPASEPTYPQDDLRSRP